MNQKIEWYKEVLALEPGSKVFFPLARMQAENGFAEDALATLRHGLSRNPEHIEARLLLIDILFSGSQYDALWPELDQIALMLGGYPGFWSAWNARLARNPSSRDAALALSFFSATLRGEAVSWSDVIENGLRQLLSPAVREGVKGVTPRIAPPELGELKSYLAGQGRGTEPKSDPESGPDSMPEDQQALAEDAAEDSDAGTVGLPDSADHTLDAGSLAEALEAVQALRDSTSGTPSAVDSAESADEDSADSDLEADDELFTLKTRSMAEVLAEQGDYAGALDIYEDLLRQADSATDKQELEAAIAALSAKAARAGDNIARHSDQLAEQAHGGEEDPQAGQGKNRLMDVLEALAQRLEARS
ncbi:MAG: tetratricopeptide repeat-containing protein [Deltaproteobacteria bacterium]|jgi:tetratricopeptide (TPR) repeat protein|nr:tetratricopeptide repeat-containing protein [Deltaproteobacteria bacterium]